FLGTARFPLTRNRRAGARFLIAGWRGTASDDHQHLRRRFDKVLHLAQVPAREVPPLAADEVGPIEILVIALRQFRARHANLRATQHSRLLALVDAHKLRRELPTALSAGLNFVSHPRTADAQLHAAMLQ